MKKRFLLLTLVFALISLSAFNVFLVAGPADTNLELDPESSVIMVGPVWPDPEPESTTDIS